MKAKTIILFFSIGILLMNISNCQNVTKQEEYSNVQIEDMLKKFYTLYITLNSHQSTRYREKIDSIKGEYCTVKLLKYIDDQMRNERIGYDLFINGQMFVIESLKTLTIRKDSIKNNIYYVTYNWPYGDKELITTKLIIIKEKDSYKIDHIFLDEI